MNKRIIGRTVGTPISPDKLRREIGSDLSNATPLMDGEASPGVSDKVARADHKHPVDTSRMAGALSMTTMTALDSTDGFVVHDEPAKETKRLTWFHLQKIIRDLFDGKISANAVADEADTGYKAVIPELEDDAVLALASDITKALADYYKKTETYSRTEIDGKVDAVAANAQPKGDYLIPSDLSGHNVATDSHNDIRLLIEGLTARLNAIADSDDDTLDQMSEIVAYIKANKALIESITTSKVNVSDIVNNLTTNVSDKPLSAAQGVALKALIDAITVPTKLSDLSADSTHRVVTDAEKSAWNAKSNFSGKYADLDGKPTIPSKPSDIGAQPAGSYVTSDKTITITGVDESGTTHTWTVYGVKS